MKSPGQHEHRYWVIKGRRNENNWERMLTPKKTALWHTGKPPSRLWGEGDRIFFWESQPGRKLIGLGELLNPNKGRDANGDTLYEVEYLTRALKRPATLEELRNIASLREASFLKAGPAGSVFRLRPFQAEVLFGILVSRNPGISDIWPDLSFAPVSDPIPDIDLSFLSAREGAARQVEHIIRERSRSVVNAKKQLTLQEFGLLRCEVCNFDFQRVFGNLGTGFCEVHHRVPLSDLNGKTETRLEDLAILCSNCHRIIHRSRPMLSVEALRDIITENEGRR